MAHFRRILAAACLIVSTPLFAAETYQLNIEPQPLAAALLQFAQQSGLQIVYYGKVAAGRNANAVIGNLTAAAALERLLAGTDLHFETLDRHTIAITDTSAANRSKPQVTTNFNADTTGRSRLAQASASQREEGGEASRSQREATGDSPAEGDSPNESPALRGIPEILVEGSKILNLDIPRDRDSPQPYVVFDAEHIRQSGAANLDDFLKQRLPMNTAAVSSHQSDSTGNRSQINLRGLGANQTLILVDGRRLASSATFIVGGPSQPDINGIPLAAVERIEVLPSTASGIYGGSATGGALNIILKRDYVGTEATLSYDNTFDSDAAIRTVGLNTGFTLEEGRTSVLLAAHYSDSNALTARDRDFVQRGRLLQFANNPASFQPPNLAPLGGTPNIRSIDNSILTLRPELGGASLGSSFTSVPYGYRGVAASGVAGLVGNAGRYNLDLADTAQRDAGKAGLANSPTVKSALVTVRREFGPRVQAFVDVSASENEGQFAVGILGSAVRFTVPSTAATNPFQQSIQVMVPTTISDDGEHVVTDRELRATGGIIFKLSDSWQGEADYSWLKTRHQSASAATLTADAATAVANGAIDVLRDTVALPLDFSSYYLPHSLRADFPAGMKNAMLRVSGPVGSLPAGSPVVSMALEWRDEFFREASDSAYSAITPGNVNVNIAPSRSQQVASLYLEARLPLVSARNMLPGIRELELQIAARRDDYEVNGSTSFINRTNRPDQPVDRFTNELHSLDPTVALRWKPLEDLAVRASYGTGFLPPTVAQSVPTFPAVFATQLLDPRRGGSQTNLIATQNLVGGNPNLEPEESKSLSAGIILTPRWLRGLRLSLDYTKIDSTGGIQSFPGGNQGVLDNESLFPERVVRGPNLPGDPPGWAGPVILLDSTLVNISSGSLEAYDAQLDYVWDSERLGRFSFYSVATWTAHRTTQLAPGEPVLENVGYASTAGNPLQLKFAAGISWSRRQWILGWNARYFDSYFAYAASTTGATLASTILSQGNGGRVEDQIYHDVFGIYRFGESSDPGSLRSRLLDRTEVTFGIRNVFNEVPPYQFNGAYFISPYGDARLASYYLTLKRSF